MYDELLRRTNNSAENEGEIKERSAFLADQTAHHPLLMHSVPFLPVREDFHPKRNQARQKLATLPASRFKDLSSDVFYELSRRYPEFKEQVSPSQISIRSFLTHHHRLVFKTDPLMNTHHRNILVHLILPRYHHYTTLNQTRKNPPTVTAANRASLTSTTRSPADQKPFRPHVANNPKMV